jgi:acyl carrier protein
MSENNEKLINQIKDSYDEPREVLSNYLTNTIEKSFGIKKNDIQFNMGFKDLGIPSKGLLELHKGLAEGLEIELSNMLFFEYPTLNKLISHLCEEIESNGLNQAA